MNADSDLINRENADTARILADFVHDLDYEMLDEKTVETTKLFIADYVAACYAGKRINSKFNRAVLEVIGAEPVPGNKEKTLCKPGNTTDEEPAGRAMSPEDVAFVNALFAHGADMDDGNRKAMGHVAAHVMSAAFAVAGAEGGKTYRDVFTAINAGYEVYNRVAAMAQPGLVHRGFHSTGTAGVMAAAATAAKLMGCTAQEIYNAIGIAAIQASGLIIIAESGQACKPLNPANAARNGIISAKLAKAGVAGPVRPLESEKGWFHAMTDRIKYEMLEGLGKEFTICESYLKPYPSCRHTHCGIEAAAGIRGQMYEKGLSVNDIRSLKLYIYENAIRIAGQIRVPVSLEDRKFSIHFSLATAMEKGTFSLDDLENEPSEAVKELIGKTELISDETMEDTKAGIRGARLEVTFGNGTVIDRIVLLPKGDAANPFTWDDMLSKMKDCLKGTGLDAAAVCAMLRKTEPDDICTGIPV